MQRRTLVARARDLVPTYCAAAAAIAVIAAALWWTQLRLAAAGMEEGYMLELPLRVLHGAVPEKSFEFFYGPLGLWIPAVVYDVLGATLAVERAIGAAYLAVLAIAFYMLGARMSWTLGAVLALITLLIGQFAGNIGYLSALPLTGALAFSALGLGVGGLPRDGMRFDVGAGVLLGVAADLRPEFVVFGAVAVAVLILLRVRGSALVVAFMATLLPYLVLVGLAGFGNVWQVLVVDALHLPAQRRLPLLGVGHPAVGALFAFAGEICSAIYIARKQGRTPMTAIAVLMTLLTAFAASDFIQRADGVHLETFLAVLVPVGILLACQVYEVAGRPLRPPVIAAAVVAIIASLTAVRVDEAVARSYLAASVHGTTESYPVHNDGRTWLYGSAMGADDARRIVRAADRISDRTKGAALFVGTADLSQTWGVDDSFYFLLPRFVQRSHYYDFYPGIALDEGRVLARSVLSASVLILTRMVFDEPNLSARHGSQAANAVVRSDYKLVLRAGSYFLYERR
jgi:hypothetical protein